MDQLISCWTKIPLITLPLIDFAAEPFTHFFGKLLINQPPWDRYWTSTACIPYVPKISEAIRRTFIQEGIRVAFTSTNTLGKSLTHVEDSFPKYNAGRLVNKLSGTTLYIGETSRSVDEHSRLTKRHPK